MDTFMSTENTITQVFPEEYFNEIKKQQEQESVVHATTGSRNFPKLPPVIKTAVKGYHIKRRRKVFVCRYENLTVFDMAIPKLRIIVKK